MHLEYKRGILQFVFQLFLRELIGNKSSKLICFYNSNAWNDNIALYTIDIPENIPSGTKRKLPPAQDPDEDGVKSYQIVQGNVGEAFDLQFDGQEALDLVVKGNLDRERLDKYSMVILAEDGGTPSRSSSMTLTVQVQDLNDSPPVFSKQR